jgi:hypothetical protein
LVDGNRYGLPDVVKAPAGAGNLWWAFADALKRAKASAAAGVAVTVATVPPAAA